VGGALGGFAYDLVFSEYKEKAVFSAEEQDVAQAR
jgi:hypothetical protein